MNDKFKLSGWGYTPALDLSIKGKKVFELYYYESNTLDSLAKKTGISRNSLFTTIDKVREILKKELNE